VKELVKAAREEGEEEEEEEEEMVELEVERGEGLVVQEAAERQK
jgi:hypothetical protein